MKDAFKLYGKYFSIHLRSQMEYKASFLMMTLGQFLVSFSALLTIRFMFLRFYEVDGFTFPEVLLCFAVVLMDFALAECFARGFDTFASMLGNGMFDRILVRPRGLVFQVIATKIELSRLGRLLQAILVFCIALPESGVSWTADKILTLVLMVVVGVVVFTCLFVVYAALCFFTTEGLEFMNIFTDGGRAFGMYPFSIYGKEVLRFFTYCVPLALFQYYPLLYLTGRSQNRFYMFVPLFGLLFVLPAALLWQIGLRHYKSTGS